MASFGWSVGDVVAVGKLAWKLYNGCKNAGEDFRSLTEDVRVLQAILWEVGEELKQPTSAFHKTGKSQRQQLANLMANCNTDLRDLERFLLQYRSLSTGKPRYWDRIRFGAKSIEGLRQKLSKHAEGFNLFLTRVNTLSLGRIEQASETSTNILSDIVSKLDQLRHEVQTGQKDSSVLNVDTNWARLEQELVGQHITEHDVEANRKPIQDHVMKWLDDVRDDASNKDAGGSASSDDPKRSSSMMPWWPDNAPMTREDKRKGCYNLPLDLQEVAFLTSNTQDCPEESSAVRCESPTSYLSSSEVTSIPSEYSSRLESDQATGITTPDLCDPYELENSIYGNTSRTTTSAEPLQDQKTLIDQLDAFLLEMSTPTTLKPSRTGSSTSTATGSPAKQENASHVFDSDSSDYGDRRLIERPLALTLEEAFFGCTKYEVVPIDEGPCPSETRTVEVVVPAGSHPGSRIGVPGVGADPDGTLQDVDFVVEWKPHHLYQFDGKHLVCTLEITLLESLCGWSRTVPTLDGEEVRVERQDATPPSWSTVYLGRGMPLADARSNLVIRVNIKYPGRISPEQKRVLRSTFGDVI